MKVCALLPVKFFCFIIKKCNPSRLKVGKFLSKLATTKKNDARLEATRFQGSFSCLPFLDFLWWFPFYWTSMWFQVVLDKWLGYCHGQMYNSYYRYKSIATAKLSLICQVLIWKNMKDISHSLLFFPCHLPESHPHFAPVISVTLTEQTHISGTMILLLSGVSGKGLYITMYYS